MRLYELLKKTASKISTEHSEALFDYFLHAMDDDGGFLRTRWCYWEKPLEDHTVSDNIRTVLIVLKSPFDLTNDSNYYEQGHGIFQDSLLTVLKMQLFYVDMSDEEECDDSIQWSEEVGFYYPIKIDLSQDITE